MSDKILSHEQKVEKLLVIIARTSLGAMSNSLNSFEDGPAKESIFKQIERDADTVDGIAESYAS